MGGQGVWKIELEAAGDVADGDPWMRVQHATGGRRVERLLLSVFLARCEAYFSGGGLMVEMPFQGRIGEGMIRVYLTHDEVVGFAHQFPKGLVPPTQRGLRPGRCSSFGPRPPTACFAR